MMNKKLSVANFIRFFEFILLIIFLLGCQQQSPNFQEGFTKTLQPDNLPQTDREKEAAPTQVEDDYELSEDYQTLKLIWFYTPPNSGLTSDLSENYDLFILTRRNEGLRDELLRQGYKGQILQYLLFSEIQDPGGCDEQPYHNQVAMDIGDYCNLIENHRSWFLWGSDGRMVTNDEGYVIMDPGNSQWREFFIQRAYRNKQNHGWHGVFLDNIEASLDKRERYGVIPEKYPTDEAYQQIIVDKIKYFYETYFNPNGIPLYANIISLNDPEVWYRYMEYLDGAMIENFAVGWRSGDEELEDWLMDLELAEKTQLLGKDVILVSQGEEFDHERQTFSLASYFLINYGRAYFRYSNSANYSDHWYYANYDLDLGKPLGKRYTVDGIWYRDFEKGRVIVDPGDWSANIEVFEN